MMQLTATHHARLRARERLNWNRSALERMLERVFYDGLGCDDCEGHLRNYLRALLAVPDRVCVRVYGEHVYLFHRMAPDHYALLTLYALPTACRAWARRAYRYHQALAA